MRGMDFGIDLKSEQLVLVTPAINHLFYLVTPHSDLFFRFPSFVSGVAGVILLYLVARECFTRTEALLAAFLLAVAPFHIHHSQEVRYYAHQVAFSLAGLFFLLRGIRTADRRYWAGFVACGLLNVFNHPVGLFVTANQIAVGAVLLVLDRGTRLESVRRPSWRSYALMLCPVAVAAIVVFGLYAAVNFSLFSALAGILGGSAQTTIIEAKIPPIDRLNILQYLWLRFDGTTLPWITPALLLVGIVGSLRRFRRGLIVSAGFIVPIVLLLLLARFRKYPYERYFLWVLPFVLMLVARGITAASQFLVAAVRFRKRWPRLEFSLAALILLLPYGFYALPLLEKEYQTEKGVDYKSLAIFLKERLREQEPLVVDSPPLNQEAMLLGLKHYFTYGPPRLSTMPDLYYLDMAAIARMAFSSSASWPLRQMNIGEMSALDSSQTTDLDEIGARRPYGWYLRRISRIYGVKPESDSLSGTFPGASAARIRLVSPKPIPVPNGSFEDDSGQPLAEMAGANPFIVPILFNPIAFEQSSGNGIPDGWRVSATAGAVVSLDRENKTDGQRSLRVEMRSAASYFHAFSLPILALPGYLLETSVKVKTSGEAPVAAYVIVLNGRMKALATIPLAIAGKEGEWTVLRSIDPDGLASCFVTPEGTAAISVMVQVEQRAKPGSIVWFDDVRLKGGWDPTLALANLVEQHRDSDIAEARRRADSLSRELERTTGATSLANLIRNTRSAMETCKQLDLPVTIWQLANSAISAFPRAARTTESSAVIAEGKLMIEICKQAGFSDQTERLTDILARTFPDRKEFSWMTKSVKSVVVHQYDWLKDPIKVLECKTTSKDSDWLKAQVSRHAYIFPAGHGRPFPCDGSYAVQFEMKVAGKGLSPPGSLAVYLNTRSGLGPNGYDWGEFDAFSVPADTTGQMTTYTIPLRSNVETAKFIHEYRIDPPASGTSFTFEIGNMRLLRLESLAHEAPKPDGFIPFTVERPTTFIISTQRTLLSTSPVLLDYSPLKQLDSVMLTTGEHILTLPHGWSEGDVAIRPKEGIHFGRDFLSIYGGIMEYGVAKMFVQDGKFDIATSLTANTEYAISVEAENSRIHPTTLALRSPDGKTELAQYVFDRRDDSMSWQEKKIVPPQDMNRISLVFISDYTGPKGDLNARVRSVRVVLLGPSHDAK